MVEQLRLEVIAPKLTWRSVEAPLRVVGWMSVCFARSYVLTHFRPSLSGQLSFRVTSF